MKEIKERLFENKPDIIEYLNDIENLWKYSNFHQNFLAELDLKSIYLKLH